MYLKLLFCLIVFFKDETRKTHLNQDCQWWYIRYSSIEFAKIQQMTADNIWHYTVTYTYLGIYVQQCLASTDWDILNNKALIKHYKLNKKSFIICTANSTYYWQFDNLAYSHQVRYFWDKTNTKLYCTVICHIQSHLFCPMSYVVCWIPITVAKQFWMYIVDSTHTH